MQHIKFGREKHTKVCMLFRLLLHRMNVALYNTNTYITSELFFEIQMCPKSIIINWFIFKHRLNIDNLCFVSNFFFQGINLSEWVCWKSESYRRAIISKINWFNKKIYIVLFETSNFNRVLYRIWCIHIQSLS